MKNDNLKLAVSGLESFGSSLLRVATLTDLASIPCKGQEGFTASSSELGFVSVRILPNCAASEIYSY